MISFGKAVPYLVVGLGGVILVLGAYNKGYSNGERNVQGKWDKVELARANKSNEILANNTVKENTHGTESQEISYDLTELEKIHDRAIAVITNDYNKRLRVSEQRAKIFESMSKATAAEQSSLASHAAKLDRSLEEGRQLVSELGETVKLRDGQLILLGSQITSDRNLINGSGTTDAEKNKTRANGTAIDQP